MHSHRIFSGDGIYDMRVCCHDFCIINDLQDIPQQYLAHTFCNIVSVNENICGALLFNLDNKHLNPKVPESLLPRERERNMGILRS